MREGAQRRRLCNDDDDDDGQCLMMVMTRKRSTTYYAPELPAVVLTVMPAVMIGRPALLFVEAGSLLNLSMKLVEVYKSCVLEYQSSRRREVIVVVGWRKDS